LAVWAGAETPKPRDRIHARGRTIDEYKAAADDMDWRRKGTLWITKQQKEGDNVETTGGVTLQMLHVEATC
jgi:hypothetical protein